MIQWKTKLLWHVLFMDCFFLFLRFGGISVVDLLIHAVFLFIAIVLIGLHRKVLSVNPGFWIVFTLFLILGLIQLIPLSAELFPVLAPIKHRIVQSTTAIFPAITYTTEITMIPSFHRFRLAMAILDMMLVMLVLMVPRPGGDVLRFWIYLINFCLAMLMILGGIGVISTDGFLSMYHGTYGGLVNINHFGTMAAIFSVLLLYFVITDTMEVRAMTKRESHVQKKRVKHAFLRLGLSIVSLILMLIAFQFGRSRAGSINLILGLVLFLSLTVLVREARRRRIRYWVKYAIVFSFLAVCFLFFPLGKRNIQKYASQGMKDKARIDYLKVGLEYLREGPILGTGFGSTESLLDPVKKKRAFSTSNSNQFHNEYMQVAVEYGGLGIICFGLLMLILLRDLLDSLWHSDSKGRIFLYAVSVAIFAISLHSLVSFPLEITSIRVFMVLLVGLALKQGQVQKEPWGMKHVPFFLLTVFFIVAVFDLGNGYKKQLPMVHSKQEQAAFASKYGSYFQSEFYIANEMAGKLFTGKIDLKMVQQHISAIRGRLYKYLRSQPFSIKALNLLFMMEVVEGSLANPEFDVNRFLKLKEKGIAIRKLGKDRNYQSRMSLYFLYSTYKPYLNEEEMNEYEALQKPYKKVEQGIIEEMGIEDL